MESRSSAGVEGMHIACRGHVESMWSAGVDGMYIACRGRVEGI